MLVPHFGEVVLEADGGAYTRKRVTINGRESDASLFLMHGLSSCSSAAAIKLLEGLDRLDANAREFILARHFAGDETVGEYATFHLEEVHDAIAQKFQVQSVDAETLLRRLELRGIGVFPTKDGRTFELVVDYTIDRTFVDGLLAVKHDDTGRILGVAHES
ncbi:MAG: DUF2004 domain-containing protein [Alphaproteobacteria bacterium]|nr:DUF2004 domain-containing protein [Alphaproteobacteria bacterium]